MLEQELLSFHSTALRDSTEWWFSKEARTKAGISTEEAAARLLEHAGMLYRYTADRRSLADLEQLPVEKRLELLEAACRFLHNVTLASTCRRLLRNDALDTDEMEQLREVIVQRDGLETVLETIRRLAQTLPEAQRRSLTASLARAAATLGQVDVVLRSRPDVISIVYRAVEGLEERIRTPLDRRRAWWFGEARELDRYFESFTIAPVAASSGPPIPQIPPLGDLTGGVSVFRPAAAYSPDASGPLSPQQFAPGARQSEYQTAAAHGGPGGPAGTVQFPLTEPAGASVQFTRLPDGRVQFAVVGPAGGPPSGLTSALEVVLLDGLRVVARGMVIGGTAALTPLDRYTSCEIRTLTGQVVGSTRVS